MNRLVHTLSAAALALAAAPAMAADRGPVTVVTHIDIIPQHMDQGLPLLQQFVRDSRRDPGVRAFILITWAPTNNHFQILEFYDSLAAFNAHVSAAHTVAFRTAFQPNIGSPIDERRYTPSHETRYPRFEDSKENR
jgi:quinol monooxygenase YgiN